MLKVQDFIYRDSPIVVSQDIRAILQKRYRFSLTSSAVITDFSEKWPVAYLWITQGAGKKGLELWVWAESKAAIYRTQLGNHTLLIEEMRPGGQLRAFVKGSIAFKAIISAVDLEVAVMLRTKRTHWSMIAS